MSDQPQVRVKIVLDGSATQADAAKISQDIASGFKQSENSWVEVLRSWQTIQASAPKDASEKAEEGLKGFASDFARGFQERIGSKIVDFATEKVHEAVEAIKEMPEAAVEAWAESEAQVRSLAGVLTMIDKNANSYEGLKDYAGDIKDGLEEIAMAAGTTDDALVQVFDDVISRGGKSVDQAVELTAAMAQAGKAIPGGATALSSAFEQMQMGVIRAKNPIVGLISASGLLRGNAKSVASEMMKMTPEKQMELAEKAIGRMAEKMEKVPLTFEQAKTSMDVFKGNFMEGMGKPLYEALGVGMNAIKDKFLEADGTATELGQHLLDGGEALGESLSKSLGHAIQFTTGAIDAFDKSSAEVVALWEQAFGRGDDSFENWESAGRAIGDGIMDAIKFMLKGVDFMMDSLAAVSKDVAQSRADAVLAKVRSTGGGDTEKLQAEYYKYEALAGHQLGAGSQTSQNFVNALGTRADTTMSVGDAQQAAMSGNTKKALQIFNEASRLHDEAAMQNIAKYITTTKQMADAIAKQGPEILDKGFGEFIKALSSTDPKKAQQIAKSAAPNLGVEGKQPVVNFNGNTFNIKQDFKDQEPDRVAVLFRQDIAQHAARRVQARGVLPFGF
jgi:hypothetical protein